MRKTLLFAAATMLAVTSANAQQTVKIGLIMAYSGQFADAATQMDNAIKLYVKQHGDTVAGKKIEIIRKDTGGPNPDVAKRLAQELVVRDKVDILAGFVLTPEALGAGDVSAEAKKLMVVMNAATSIITAKSPVYRAHIADHSAARKRIRRLGVQERRAQGVHDGLGLRSGDRRGNVVRQKLQGCGRRRSSDRSACRSPVLTSRPSCSARRTSTPRRFSFSFRAERSPGDDQGDAGAWHPAEQNPRPG